MPLARPRPPMGSLRRAEGPLARLAAIEVPAVHTARRRRWVPGRWDAVRLFAAVVATAVVIRMLPAGAWGRAAVAALIAMLAGTAAADGMAVRLDRWAAEATVARRELEPDALLAALVVSAPWMVAALVAAHPVLGGDVEPLTLTTATLGLVVFRALARAARLAGGDASVERVATVAVTAAATGIVVLAIDHHVTGRDVTRLCAAACVAAPLLLGVGRCRSWAAFDEVHVRSLVRASTWCAAPETLRRAGWTLGVVVLAWTAGPATAGQLAIAVAALRGVVAGITLARNRPGATTSGADAELRWVRRCVLMTAAISVGLVPTVPVVVLVLTDVRAAAVALSVMALLPAAACVSLLDALDPLVGRRCGFAHRLAVAGGSAAAAAMLAWLLGTSPVTVALASSAVAIVGVAATLVALADRADRVARSVALPTADDLRWLVGSSDAGSWELSRR